MRVKHRSVRILLPLTCGALALAFAAGAAAHEDEPTPLPVSGVDWHERGEKWFTSEDEKERKAQMKEASRSLKRPCKFCHTEDFDGFVDENRKLLVQQMMALSVENGLQCKDCHDGRDKMTKLGEEAHEMFKVAREKKVFCDECHKTDKSKFENLTEKGKKFHDEMEAKKKGAPPVAAPPSGAPSAAPSAAPK